MKKMQSNKVVKRARIFTYATLFVFSLLIARLFYIQLIKGEEYGLAALNQYIKEIRVSPPRGVIFDRNLVKLTNNNQEKKLILFTDTVKNDENALEQVRKVTSYSTNELERILDTNEKIIEVPLDEEVNVDELQINGTMVIDKVNRYSKNNILSHVIGYVNRTDNIGMSGVEKVFDDVLKQDSKFGLIPIATDGRQRLIPGMDISQVSKQKTSSSNSIKLTIDYEIQKIVEDTMDINDKNGAIVVTEVSSGDIIAMASRPNIDLTNLDRYLNSEKMELFNRATELSYPPGSIFKIVVLLSAYENNLINGDEKYLCVGYENIDNVIIGCNKKDGHGEITLSEAFYNSCNSSFIQLGKKIGANKIIETAEKLGFGSAVDIGILETEGNLPSGDELLGPAIGNISIGQGSIEVTPLQVTNMMMTIANDGIRKDLSIVDSIVTNEGRLVKKVNREENYRVISETNSKIIKKYLEDVVTKGTASNISCSEIGGAAGKTGSSQAIINGKETVHAWFSGYFPKETPEYVITVFIEGGQSGGKIAAPLFEKIAKSIYNIRSRINLLK